MIKINLLTTRVQESAAGATEMSGGLGGGGGGVENQELRELLTKVAFISLFTIGLILYESQTIRALNEQLAVLNAKVAELQAEATAKAAEVEAVKDVEVQAKELEDKLKVLKLLSKLRLREVKTLDFVQSSIPEKVWLRGVSYDSTKADVESGHFQFTGNATATEELTEFVKRLDGSAYLKDVIVVKNLEVSVNKTTSIREFQFTAEVGKN